MYTYIIDGHRALCFRLGQNAGGIHCLLVVLEEEEEEEAVNIFFQISLFQCNTFYIHYLGEEYSQNLLCILTKCFMY